ncbi:MAG TPA: hypothetical protein VFV24_07885, partial [Candidatus Eisenbacteria bacterium]|nr:hypothetical protein [Candidatus Eisenbacteria bacterium]
GFANFLFLSASVAAAGAPRNAADAFQSKGVCVLDNTAFIFRKEKLPPAYLQAQSMARWILQPQDTGLRVLGSYTLGGAGDPGAWQKFRNRLGTSPFWWTIMSPLTHRSLMANGPIGGFYPPTGILEVRGFPAPWETNRPNHSGQPAFGKHPDDVVEWIRYAEILDGAVYGEQFHLFVGRTGRNFNFRGYPERYQQGQPDMRKQLEHGPGEPVRLVMELSEGGAGHGDYVTIATSDPAVYEPQMRRVYKVLEHQDGRFFASLLDVGSGGMDIPSSPGVYQNTYTRAMNPRLVKFPSWGLPEVFSGSAVFFGEALGASPATGGRAPSTGVRSDDEDDMTGITLDEVRMLQDRTIRVNPVQGPQVRFVMVPLDGGSVPKRQLAGGGTVLSGAIQAQRSVSQASPQEVLVVSVSKEPGAPS